MLQLIALGTLAGGSRVAKAGSWELGFHALKNLNVLHE